jgi:hypothetical protein
MSKHIAISPSEAADHIAIPELVEAYAHCADRRLFAERLLRRLAGGTRTVMTATNKLVSGRSMHLLNVCHKCLIIVGERALLRFSH